MFNRIGSNTLYNNFNYYQTNSQQELTTITNQISSGKKIQDIYDDPVVFNNALRLDQEENDLNAIKQTSTSAQTFANQTDTSLNDFSNTLTSFKTKLLSAVDAANDSTSLNAIANDMEGLLDHLKNVANTSINGKYLFSGTALSTKPIDDNLNYEGNGNSLKAPLGNNVEKGYNIDGQSLFLGRDDDYKKSLTTNIQHFNSMKLNPEFVVEKDGKYYIDRDLKANDQKPASDDDPVQESLTTDSEIRMLTGVNDVYDAATDSYEDGTSYFYIKGRKPNGESFFDKFSLNNSDKVSDLLTKIGESFGNTPTTKNVDVSMNDFGQIQIKDTQSGKMITDFFMVASDTDETNMSDLVKNGDYVSQFQRSDFIPIRDENTSKANNDDFDNRVFKFGSEFRLIDNSRKATANDLAVNVLGSEALKDGSDTQKESVDFVRMSGTDTDGNNVDVNIKIDSTTKMQDILDLIKNNFGDVDVSMEDGKIVVNDNTLDDKNDVSKLSLNMQTYNDTDGDGVLNTADDDLVNSLRRSDFANDDRLSLSKDGNLITSNASQVIKDGERTVYVYDDNGNLTDTRLEKIENSQTYATNDTRLADVAGNKDATELDGKEFKVQFRDIDGNFNTAIVTLRDTSYTDGNGNEHLSTFWIDKNNDGNRDDDEVYDIFEPDGKLTPANDKLTVSSTTDPETCEICKTESLQKGATYSQLNDVISLLTTGEYQNIDNTNTNQQARFDSYKNAIATSKESVEANLNDKGQLEIKDKTTASTNMEVSIFDKDSDGVNNPSLLSFQDNDALTIDKPQIDLFHQLDSIIDDVRNGKIHSDFDSDPRSIGINNSIDVIDHIMDHVHRKHAEIGAVSNSFDMTIQRTETLIINTQTLKSDVLDTDIAEASMKLNQITLNYQALLSTIAKVNNLSLVNYVK